jgi:multidrug resistance efflux pump
MGSIDTARSRAIQARSFGVMLALTLLTLVMNAACRSSNRNETPADLVIVKATAAGEVRRVLVSEGAAVNEGAPVIEIAVKVDAPADEQNKAEGQEQARAALDAAQREIADAEAEVSRTSVEVQRVESLVRAGAAPQAQLDAARAQYQQAQERVERVRDSARSAQTGIVSRQENRSSTTMQGERIIGVPAPASGTIRVISARVGQRVTAGQAIATMSSQAR